MRNLLLFALLASCEGRCRQSSAVQDEMPRAFCVVDSGHAICVREQRVYFCSVAGVFVHTAECAPQGRFAVEAEARP